MFILSSQQDRPDLLTQLSFGAFGAASGAVGASYFTHGSELPHLPPIMQHTLSIHAAQSFSTCHLLPRSKSITPTPSGNTPIPESPGTGSNTISFSAEENMGGIWF